MKRLAEKIILPQAVKQVSDSLLNAEGTCTCGRVLRVLDAKLILMTSVPSLGQMVVAAYCLQCSRVINNALKMCQRIMQTNVNTDPVDRLK